MFETIVFGTRAGVVAWRLFRRRGPVYAPAHRGWRFVPLAAALVQLVFTVLTLGAGVILALLPFLMTVWAWRRLGDVRGVVFWLGAAFNVWWMTLWLLTVGAMVYDALIA